MFGSLILVYTKSDVLRYLSSQELWKEYLGTHDIRVEATAWLEAVAPCTEELSADGLN